MDFASSLKDNSSLTHLSLNKVDFTPTQGQPWGGGGGACWMGSPAVSTL